MDENGFILCDGVRTYSQPFKEIEYLKIYCDALQKTLNDDYQSRANARIAGKDNLRQSWIFNR